MPPETTALASIALSNLSNFPAYPILSAVRLVFLAVRSPAWKAVRIFRAEDFDAFSYDLYAFRAVATSRGVLFLSETSWTGSSLREAREMARRKTHPNSASELRTKERLDQGINDASIRYSSAHRGQNLEFQLEGHARRVTGSGRQETNERDINLSLRHRRLDQLGPLSVAFPRPVHISPRMGHRSIKTATRSAPP